MYSDEDLDAAVEEGIFSPTAVQQFRDYARTTSEAPRVDEENFRLISGFNDIFVVIASCLLLISGAWFASTFHMAFAAITLAVISWGLSEFFVRKRRMALPAILLLISFLTGICAIPLTLSSHPDGITILSSSILTTLFAWLHWRHFRVPITIAAASAVVITVVLYFGLSTYPSLSQWLQPLLFISGLLLFVFAMYWDSLDKTRKTKDSDVAFWLHLVAAPLIVHPIFFSLGILNGQTDLLGIGIVITLYVFLTIISLAVDRRAIMVSSLGYVLYAFTSLFQTYGFVSYSFALTGICIGASLLLLSAFWHISRAKILNLLPHRIRNHLPI